MSEAIVASATRPDKLLAHQSAPIRLDKVIIVTKLTKLECDMRKFGLDEAAVLMQYKEEGAPGERILESHRAQHRALDALKRVFNAEQFISRDDLATMRVREVDLVIAFGGDNHFQFVSHAIEDGLILGVNSDPVRSEGALVCFSADELVHVLSDLARGNFRVENWTRLEGTVNGKPTPRIISEFFIGERDRCDMSRYVLAMDGKTEDQKGSGLLVATGAGSTGWYRSESKDFVRGEDVSFSREAPEGRLFVTAPFHGRLTQPDLRQATLRPGQELVVRSLNDAEGIVGCDALERIPFPRGSEAIIRVSNKPLRVVLPM